MGRCRNVSEVAVLKTVHVLLKKKYLHRGKKSEKNPTCSSITLEYWDKFLEQLIA